MTKAHECVCAECERKNNLRKREPLVQEVIAKHKALPECVLTGHGDCENEDAALFDALSKLAEWKP